MKFNELDNVRTLRGFPNYGIAKGEIGYYRLYKTK